MGTTSSVSTRSSAGCRCTAGISGCHISALVVVVPTLTRIIKSVVIGQAPVTLELRNTLAKNTSNPRWYTHISQRTQFMPSPETYKSEIGSQSTTCQVQAGAYVSLLFPHTPYTNATTYCLVSRGEHPTNPHHRTTTPPHRCTYIAPWTKAADCLPHPAWRSATFLVHQTTFAPLVPRGWPRIQSE